MHQPILVLNAGSSNLKFSLFETIAGRVPAAVFHGQIDGIGSALQLEVRDARQQVQENRAVAGDSCEDAIAAIHAWCVAALGSDAALDGIGHRVVHGGLRFSGPTLIDPKVLAALDELVPLAPLHQPRSLATIRAMQALAPGVAQVACFDTTFHRGQPPLAQHFALPRALTDSGIRRYGFHGLSYEYIVTAMQQLSPAHATDRIVVAHLGNGASMCAIEGGRSMACTMGFSTADGLPMGTRSGALDPGVILYLLTHARMDAQQLEDLIYHRSGLLGVSGISPDMRTLLASAAPAAAEAIALFVYQIGRSLGSLVAALGGLDALVFTGGIGEHAAQVRAQVCNGARWLGIELDDSANLRGGPRISPADRWPAVWVMPTDENLMIARHARAVLDSAALRLH